MPFLGAQTHLRIREPERKQRYSISPYSSRCSGRRRSEGPKPNGERPCQTHSKTRWRDRGRQEVHTAYPHDQDCQTVKTLATTALHTWPLAAPEWKEFPSVCNI